MRASPQRRGDGEETAQVTAEVLNSGALAARRAATKVRDVEVASAEQTARGRIGLRT